ncbi:ANTAR domain-containing response regulator [Melghirimyces algeriensis]|uniref:Response regulator receiver and ANTAR domain protein n=1 Tax=Melghirimyces algeriensis TaxID=910412 RepID=A0A521CGT0_9BACL|nr:response regulator [Melghirimyces algeriensis]SMO57971.1 response regulator receiver and ANTAR domain protein [Melghirimyces algeriensis]
MPERILVAEDESIMRMDLKEMLMEAGYEIAGEAGDGERAVELSYRFRPDLIIMDIKMPKMNGIKASRIITRSLQIPILLLTAYSQRELIEQAKDALVTGYLVKPVRESDLIPAVEVALAQAGRIASMQQKMDTVEQKLKDRKVVERAKGLLMKQYDWSEEQAYQYLRKSSMDRQIPIGERAGEILKKQEGKVYQK